MGTYNLAAGSSGSGGSSYTFIIVILVIFVAFYFLMIRPQQRRRQAQMQQQNTLGPGARVRTTAGMYATVVAVDGDDVVLEVAPGIEVRYMKRAIMDVVSPGDTSAADMSYEAADEPADDEPADVAEEPDGTVETPHAATAEDTDETAYERATGTKKD